ncbi:type IV pilus modification PilV family protein [Rubellicoccus peritrichatus]|uniref:Prepilin-type N-terminal cleavage/methylation domain-containing protein n=1 Tax=Rubellicoccus peritrichatus TaxID=3080537 RepID=A0AAQ3LES6_9BACT|nr:prepilin-type N-terminal cleavage/methylation domain-containing protein [Puniceicoccus sp. CR14]WOO43387.1 prepilin-type N-terminal cleavage/methylation domain-containing protein [Puniceicoccus sp. CR14]
MRENISSKSQARGFSLVEVVLAIGVLSLAVVALLGLFGPTMGSVKQVIDTNQATAVVSRVNAEIQRGMTWADIQNGIAGGGEMIFYVWKRQEDTNKPVSFAMSGGNSSGTDYDADLDGDGTNDVTIKGAGGDFETGKLVGTPMIVTFEQGLQGGSNPYDFSNVANEGYMPIFVSIFPVDPNQIGKSDYDSVDEIKQTVEPIFTYTTAKTRSL